MSQGLSEDPVVDIVAEAQRIRGLTPLCDAEEALDANLALRVALGLRLINTAPVSLAGVASGLEEALYELTESYGGLEDDYSYKIVLSQIEATIQFLKEGEGYRMPSPAAERKASQIADDFLDLEVDSDAEAKKWLVEKISAALEEAKEAGYKEAMKKRF